MVWEDWSLVVVFGWAGLVEPSDLILDQLMKIIEDTTDTSS
jgi:hypothetical protein